MRYEKRGDATHIFMENDETEQEVLRAIVKASFNLARPAGLGWLRFDDSQQMTDEMADQHVALNHDSLVIGMDYVQGRLCKTFVHKIETGHYALANRIYERDRGLPDPMLDRAKEILTGKPQDADLSSTSQAYTGQSLTLRLKELGFDRQHNEDDWSFRKRVFPDLFQTDSTRAMEFLQGASAAEWDEMSKTLFLFCLMENGGQPNHSSLVKFAEGFAADPIEMRKK